MRVDRHRAGIVGGQPGLGLVPVENQASGHHPSDHAAFARSLWRIAVLTAAGAIGTASYAEAAVPWSDSDPGFARPAPPRRHKSHRHSAHKIEAPAKEKE